MFFLPHNHAGTRSSLKRNSQLRIEQRVDKLWDAGSTLNLRAQKFVGAGKNQGGVKWNIAV